MGARANALESPWVLDDLTQLVGEIGDRLDVVMIPKVEGRGTSTTSTGCWPSSRRRANLQRPAHPRARVAILETAQGVANVEEIATAGPRMQGMSLGPADLAASRRMKTTRVGGGHPGYRVLSDPDGDARRTGAQQDLWHYTLGRMVDACAAAGILPFYCLFGDIRDLEGCEAQVRAAYLMGCVGAWSLHPVVQIDVARRVFSPDPDEVKFAKKVIEAIPMAPASTWSTARCRTTRPGSNAGSWSTWRRCLPARTPSWPRRTSSRSGTGAGRRNAVRPSRCRRCTGSSSRTGSGPSTPTGSGPAWLSGSGRRGGARAPRSQPAAHGRRRGGRRRRSSASRAGLRAAPDSAG